MSTMKSSVKSTAPWSEFPADFDEPDGMDALAAPDLNVDAGDVVSAIIERYRSEAWTVLDLYAAMLQASLLSYRSSESAADIYGDRYVDSSPSFYAHNCPWNDWTPPSKSTQLFEEANKSARIDPVSKRVRVHVCRTVDGKVERCLLAFASVEGRSTQTKCLVLRRGTEVLASFNVDKLKAWSVGERLVSLTTCSHPDHSTQLVCLWFETCERLAKFCDMLLAE